MLRNALLNSCLPALWLAAAALGQSGPPLGAGPLEAEAGDPVPESAGALLREGSSLVEARGSLRRGEQGTWVFRTAQPPRREFTLLPCTLLGSLETAVESSPEREIAFDLSGRIYAYRGRNYLLPTHAPRLVDHVAPPVPAVRGAAGDSAEAMLRELEQSVGPVARSAAAGQPAPPPPPRVQRELPPGALLMWRRGWMVREPDATWSFVFEADATGLADPPVLLMPCMLLEAMEAQAGTGGPKKPLLLCGLVHRYHGRTWLMPTMHQVPRHTTPLRN